jgi:cell division septation protein DedD
MANYERGVYEPSDEVRVFDGSEEDDDVEGSRLPLLIVLALLVLAMFGGVVWLAYTQGVARGRGETPVLTAAAGPERVAPAGGGGGTVPYQGFKIYEQPAPPDDTADNIPAAPAPQAAPQAAPKPAPAAPPPIVQAAKPAPPPVTPAPAKSASELLAAPTPATLAAPPPKPAPASKATPMPAKAAAAPPPKSVAALIQQANSVPETPAKPAGPPPAMKQSMAATPVPTGGPATGAPRQLGGATATPAAPAKTAAPAPAKPASGGSYVLQIGAYTSQADAETAWKAYKARHSALLSGYSDDVQQADLGAKGTWYRLRIGGLSDKEAATALCDKLKADGGACILGR